MTYLVRKISRGKWTDCDSSRDSPISADAATNCLKTTGNTLSVWYAESVDDLEKAKLALMAAMQNLESIDLVVLRVDEVTDQGLKLEETDPMAGPTVFRELHRDIAKLDLEALGKVARLIQSRLVDVEEERITRGDFKSALEKAIKDNLFMSSELHPKLAEKLTIQTS